jgi:hypothetical protein
MPEQAGRPYCRRNLGPVSRELGDAAYEQNALVPQSSGMSPEEILIRVRPGYLGG